MLDICLLIRKITKGERLTIAACYESNEVCAVFANESVKSIKENT